MNQPADQPSRVLPVPVEPSSEGTHSEIADELMVHGLMSYLAQDSIEDREGRVRRAMAAIAAEPSRSFRFRPAAVRRWGALAAVLAIATVAVLLGIPLQPSAQALVKSSIAATRAPGDRRYEIRELRGSETALRTEPELVVDTRTGGLALIKGTSREGHPIIAGRDATGPWAIRMDGTIARDHAERAWPRWSTVGDESLFVDSVDRLLEAMEQSYTLERMPASTIDGRGDRKFDHIHGRKKLGTGPGAAMIDVWTDPSTKLVEHLVMRWERPDRPMGGPRPDGGGPRPDGPPPMRPPPGDHPFGGPQGPPFGPPPEMGPRPAPPKLVAIDRADPPGVDDAWFSPEAHESH